MSFIRGNNIDRKRRRKAIVKRDSVNGVIKCRYCMRKLDPERINVVRLDLEGRFTIANCGAACDTCTRTPAIRALTA